MVDGIDIGGKALIARDGLDGLLTALAAKGYRVIGPTVRDGAVVYDEIAGIGDLPQGWGDRQDGGHYRIEKRDDRALFGYAATPQSLKRYLHPPTQSLFRAARRGDGFAILGDEKPQRPMAFIGVRACDLQAIAVQDRVLEGDAYADHGYHARRTGIFIVAVNCSEPGGTCFCVSMQTGPKAESGFDLALTELVEGADHRFLVEIGSEAGGALLAEISTAPARAEDEAAASALVERSARRMGRSMAAEGLRDLLRRNLDHPRWDQVAERCLTCGNCTMVCPTCFCTTVEDITSLDGATSERVQRWDSCFTLDFSYIHGGSVRASPRSRYRQWMTHKLSTWFDQFGSSGCVGCGRCITWCPVGIDITEEVAAIRASDAGGA